MSRKNGFKTFNGKGKEKKPLNYKEIFGDDKNGIKQPPKHYNKKQKYQTKGDK